VLDAQVGSWRQAFGVEREQPETVAMHAVSSRRRRPVVAAAPEVVDAHPEVLGPRSIPESFRQHSARPVNVVDSPVAERSGRSIGVLDDQGKALGPWRRVRPFQWWRHVLTVAGVAARYRPIVFEGWALQ